MKRLAKQGKKFDVVLSTYGPPSVHHIAGYAKRRGVAAEWIADFRDVVEYPFRWQRGQAKRLIARVRKNADEIVSVSEGYLTSMGLADVGHTITNGFDVEDLQGIAVPPPEVDGSLRLVYCGQMYGAQRDLRPCFRALRDLIQERAIAEEKVQLHFAGKPREAEVFAIQAAECGLAACVVNHGLVPRDEAIRLQLAADAVLVAAWNTPECLGNLPGKLLEVLMMRRPVVCCTVGDIPGSAAAQLVQATDIGYCWEEAEGETSYLGLKEYLRGLCEAAAAGRRAAFLPNEAEVEKYAYPEIARQMAALMQRG